MSPWAALGSVALLVANGLFVAAEFALLAARRPRIEQLAAEGDARAQAALASLDELTVTLAGAQLGITMASLGLGALAEPALAHLIEGLLERAGLADFAVTTIGFTVALSIVVFLHMVVGEMAPKSVAISHPERSALLLARPFRLFINALRPFVMALNSIANGVVRALGVTPQETVATAYTPADLVWAVRESAQVGSLSSDEEFILTRALELSGLDAKAVMVPRSDIVAVPSAATVAEIEQVAVETGRSRLPVYARDLDQLIGVLHIKSLLPLDDAERERMRAGRLARPAMVVPESSPIEDVMLDMQQRRQHIALVVDEYGSVAGLVALEDLIEELIGEFDDETDRVARRLRRRPGGRYVVSGSIRPDELAQTLAIHLPSGPYETLAGFVISLLDAVPEAGSTVTWRGLKFTVLRRDGWRITELEIRPAPEAGQLTTAG